MNDIKHRLHKLRVRKGKNKAMKKFNKIYHIENTMDIEEEESSHIKSKKQKKITKILSEIGNNENIKEIENSYSTILVEKSLIDFNNEIKALFEKNKLNEIS